MNSSPLDRIAFANDRQDDLRDTEENNPSEQSLFDSLLNHVLDNSEISEQNLNVLINAVKSDQYRDMFPLYDGTYIYRGMRVSEGWLKDNFGIDANELEKNREIQISGTYIPKYKYSSWSSDEEYAIDLACYAKLSMRNMLPIVLIAKTKDCEMAIDMIGWYNLIDDEFRYEQEILSIGNIPIVSIMLAK